jgi:formate dehydrogenase (coenzyme F420) beta subunit
LGQQLRHQPGQLPDQPQGKIGIFAKGCDSRNIVTHILENKIQREQLVVIGVPCLGMIDKRKIAAATEGEILAVTESGDQVTVETAQGTRTFAKADVLQQNCASAPTATRSSTTK